MSEYPNNEVPHMTDHTLGPVVSGLAGVEAHTAALRKIIEAKDERYRQLDDANQRNIRERDAAVWALVLLKQQFEGTQRVDISEALPPSPRSGQETDGCLPACPRRL